MDQNAPKFHQIYTIFICCDLELVSLKFVICNDSTGVIVGLFSLLLLLFRLFASYFPSTTPQKPYKIQQNEKYILNHLLLVQGIGQYHSRTTKPKPAKQD